MSPDVHYRRNKMSSPSIITMVRRYQPFQPANTVRLSRKTALTLTCRRGFRRVYSIEHPQRITFSQKFPPIIAGVCVVSSLLASLAFPSSTRALKNDSSKNTELALEVSARTEITVNRPGDLDGVPTGTSTVPLFPHTLWLPRIGAAHDRKSSALPAGLGALDTNEEYHLLGLGIRTVSFLGIQVYVVGIYVAVSDLARLQESMVRAIAMPGATTLVEREKGDLSRLLADAKGSEQIWGTILKQDGIKSVLRIVPTRSSGFGHLRDGWLKGITARGKKEKFDDEDFVNALGKFKSIFGGTGIKGLEKGKALLLARGGDGLLRVCLEKANAEFGASGNGDAMALMGVVEDERISRLLWLGYLAGGTVASEEARRSVVDGVLDLVERPIGTMETRVI